MGNEIIVVFHAGNKEWMVIKGNELVDTFDTEEEAIGWQRLHLLKNTITDDINDWATEAGCSFDAIKKLIAELEE